MPLITQGLRPDLKTACPKETAVLLERNQKLAECTHSEELAAFLTQELPNGRQEGRNSPVCSIRDRGVHLLLTAFIRHSPVNPRRMASGASGRTSTAPIDAPGHRAAHSSAASMEGSSRMMNPASCSFVSA